MKPAAGDKGMAGRLIDLGLYNPGGHAKSWIKKFL
jgi:hypothetical protein